MQHVSIIFFLTMCVECVLMRWIKKTKVVNESRIIIVGTHATHRKTIVRCLGRDGHGVGMHLDRIVDRSIRLVTTRCPSAVDSRIVCRWTRRRHDLRNGLL